MSRTRAALVAAASLLASHAQAQAPPPTLTVSGHTATFANPVAFFDAGTARLSVLFPRVALAPEVEATARASGSWEAVAASVAPAVIADFHYTPGSTSGLVDALKACTLTAVGFTTAWRVAGGAAECHVISIGGMLKSGGGIAGLLEGTGTGYALRLPFAGPLMEAAATNAGATPTPAGSAAPAAAAAPAAPAVPAVPLHAVTGTAAYRGSTLRATHALAWWAAQEGQVRLALFDHPPSAGMLAAARKGEFGEEAPVMDLYLGFEGAGRDLASVNYCYINATFPKGGTMGTNTRAQGCGLTTLVTDGAPGGTVLVIMKGDGPGPAARYTWDITLHVPIAKEP